MTGRIGHGVAGLSSQVDLLVIGLGVTGTGVALDAVTRGLSVIAVDAHDVAFGTSRWSSKLVHGGLRYLASGQVGIARESSVERGILMLTTAPHLTRPLVFLMPLTSEVSRAQAALARVGLLGGDVLRRAAHTSSDLLPRPRRVSRQSALALAPGLREQGLRGGLVYVDGQLEDDARLVTCLARTAASNGADVRTRTRALAASGTSVTLRDELTGEHREIRARAVVNATGVWAGSLVADVRLRPSRGTHLVVRGDLLPGRAAVTVPIPGTVNRFVLVLPQPDGTCYVGLTDEPVAGEVPDVPEPTEPEIDFLLGVLAAAFDRPFDRRDVVGAYAGLRPLLESEGETADLSRRHAVLTSADGVITIVGGKLTTYRKMAEDAVDATGLADGRCVTRRLPLLGAAPRADLARIEAPARLVRRFGTEAGLVLDTARSVTSLSDAELLAPIAPHLPATLAELVFGITHEGALDTSDLLDRRTRIGLIPPDRLLALPVAERALTLAAPHPPPDKHPSRR